MLEECKELKDSLPGVEGDNESAQTAEQKEVIVKTIEDLEKYPENQSKPGYPMGKENAMLAAFRRGECEEGKKELNELLALLIYSYSDQFRYIQLRVLELVVLLSRIEGIL